MDKIDLLYDHYKETNLLISEKIKQRDKAFVFTFIIEFVLLLFSFNPDEYSNLVFRFINDQYSIDLKDQFIVIQTFLWIALLYETLRYSQAVVYIEREYKYINALEIQISKLFFISFGREGKDYKNNYPAISNLVNIIYKYVFALFSVVVATIKIISECNNLNVWYLLLVDIILYIIYLLLWLFHSCYVIKNDN